MVDKIVPLEDAIATIDDGDTICVSGFVGIGTLLLVVLLATLASTAISLTVCYGLLKTVRANPLVA